MLDRTSLFLAPALFPLALSLSLWTDVPARAPAVPAGAAAHAASDLTITPVVLQQEGRQEEDDESKKPRAGKKSHAGCDRAKKGTEQAPTAAPTAA